MIVAPFCARQMTGFLGTSIPDFSAMQTKSIAKKVLAVCVWAVKGGGGTVEKILMKLDYLLLSVLSV